MLPPAIFVCIFLICGLITAAVAIVLMAWGAVHPPRMTDGKAISVLRRLSPNDLGLSFEPVEFPIRDERGRELMLAGWWVPARIESGRCAVLLHGYGDAKVGAIAWAPLFHDAGCNMLALDLRAHGDSGGEYTTAGFFERQDLAQVLGQLRAAHAAGSKQLFLFGASTGGAVALAAATDESLDVAAVIVDSPYADFNHTAMANFDRLSLPGRAFQRAALRLAEIMAHCNFAAVAPTCLLPRVRCPVLMILPARDTLVTDADRQSLQQALSARANPQDHLWLVPNCPHLLALQNEPAEYARRLGEFLEAANSTRHLRKVDSIPNNH